MIKLIAFRGATAWEAYFGPAWIRILYPRFWHSNSYFFGRHWIWPVSVGWDNDDD